MLYRSEMALLGETIVKVFGITFWTISASNWRIFARLLDGEKIVLGAA